MRTPAPQTLTMDSSSRPHSPAPKEVKLSHLFGLYVVWPRASEKRIMKLTTKAGMCMKTKETRTFCHPNRRTFYAKRHESSGILSPNDTNRRTFYAQLPATVANRAFSPITP